MWDDLGSLESIPYLENQPAIDLIHFVKDIEKETGNNINIDILTRDGKIFWNDTYSHYGIVIPDLVEFHIDVFWNNYDEETKRVNCYTKIDKREGFYCYGLTDAQAVKYVKSMYRYAECFLSRKSKKKFRKQLKKYPIITYENFKLFNF